MYPSWKPLPVCQQRRAHTVVLKDVRMMVWQCRQQRHVLFRERDGPARWRGRRGSLTQYRMVVRYFPTTHNRSRGEEDSNGSQK